MDKDQLILHDEVIISSIYLIRARKVMLDKDLAEIYGVDTKRLKEAVRRNITRFPDDFIFELTKNEFEHLRTQFASSSWGGARYVPMAFTDYGVLMLSGVLNSDKAISVNIQIMRIFAKIQKELTENLSFNLEIEVIKKKLKNHDKNIEEIFTYLDELIKEQEKPDTRKRIGFRLPD